MSMTAGILPWQVLPFSFISRGKQSCDVHVQESHLGVIVNTVLNRHDDGSDGREELGFNSVAIHQSSFHRQLQASIHDDTLDQDIGMAPACLGLPETNGDGDSQASIDYDHRVELSVSLRSTSRKVATYMGVGIRSDELLVSIDYRLDPATYHGDIGCSMSIYHTLSSNDASSITESTSIVSHNHTADTSGNRLT